jgi:hypothetical protein
MSPPCPQCGAVLPSGESCQDRFNLSQVIELEQPAYYAVHHLSVPCYLLQHNAYSHRGWLEVRKLLAMFVHEGWTPQMARRQIKANAAGKNWSLTRGEKLPGVEDIAWTATIAGISLDSAEAYCADVRRWAAQILVDSEQLVQTVTDQEEIAR